MASSTKTVVAINGFLGRTSDWSLIKDLIPKDWVFHAVDIWAETALDFDEWASRFTASISQSIAGPGPKVLLGYSMGGRLALHALVKAPHLFDGAVIVSANPGLMAAEERSLRRSADDVWASKFLQEPWPSLMQEWNGQTSLRPPKNPGEDCITLERREGDFERPALAKVLRTWSLGMQRNLRDEVDALKLPIEFVTGQDDVKFTSIAREWMKHEASGERAHSVVENAGHRVPWDAPAQFRAILANFLARW